MFPLLRQSVPFSSREWQTITSGVRIGFPCGKNPLLSSKQKYDWDSSLKGHVFCRSKWFETYTPQKIHHVTVGHWLGLGSLSKVDSGVHIEVKTRNSISTVTSWIKDLKTKTCVSWDPQPHPLHNKENMTLYSVIKTYNVNFYNANGTLNEYYRR